MLRTMTDDDGVPHSATSPEDVPVTVPRQRADLRVLDGGRVTEFDGVDFIEQEWRRERPDIDVSSFGIVTRIWRIGRHLETKRGKLLAELATDRGSMDMLAMLRRSGKPYRQTAGQLTRSALITSGGVSQRLEKLERAGLISRHVDPKDRRRVDVQLTPTGAALVDTVLADMSEHDLSLLAEALEPHEQEMLRSLLRKFLLSLEPSDKT